MRGEPKEGRSGHLAQAKPRDPAGQEEVLGNTETAACSPRSVERDEDQEESDLSYDTVSGSPARRREGGRVKLETRPGSPSSQEQLSMPVCLPQEAVWTTLLCCTNTS